MRTTAWRRLQWGAIALFLPMCAAPTPPDTRAPTALEGTTWNLVQLLHQPVVSAETEAPPSLRLDVEGNRATGSGGCNRFTGSYTLEGMRLRIGPLATTRRSCAHGMVEEEIFFDVLARTRRWQVTDHELALHDGSEHPLARFVAAP